MFKCAEGRPPQHRLFGRPNRERFASALRFATCRPVHRGDASATGFPPRRRPEAAFSPEPAHARRVGRGGRVFWRRRENRQKHARKHGTGGGSGLFEYGCMFWIVPRRGPTLPPTSARWLQVRFRREQTPICLCITRPAGRGSGLRPPDRSPAAAQERAPPSGSSAFNTHAMM